VTWSPWRELAARPDIWVHRCLLEDALGWWCPQERVILLDARLDRRTARSVLAHELGHAVLGHVGAETFAEDEWLARRQERQADRWAAARLVRVADLAEVLVERPAGPEVAASALNVTEAVLSVRLAMLEPAERRELTARLELLEHVA
jgi:Zn-dependent peptidase ImmA (M78 family)